MQHSKTKSIASYEKIELAASALYSERGKLPTVREIREKLGGGSLGDIAPKLKHWKASQRTKNIDGGYQVFSQGLQESVESLFNEIREFAEYESKIDIERIRIETDETQDQLDGAIADNKALETENNRLRKALDTAKQQIDEAERVTKEQSEQLNDISHQHSIAVNTIKQLHERIQYEATATNDRIASHRSTEQALTDQRKYDMESIKSKDSEIRSLTKQVTELESLIHQNTAKIQSLTDENHELIKTCDAQQKANTVSASQIQRLKDKYDEQAQRIRDYREKDSIIVNLSKENGKLTAEVQNMDDKVKQLSADLKKQRKGTKTKTV